MQRRPEGAHCEKQAHEIMRESPAHEPPRVRIDSCSKRRNFTYRVSESPSLSLNLNSSRYRIQNPSYFAITGGYSQLGIDYCFLAFMSLILALSTRQISL